MASESTLGALDGLTRFQRDTVEHIIDRFYRTRGTSRFLVADETGLGKTMVARGVIARAIEELNHEDTVDRIDVVYVCSNQDLARQNLAKLTPAGLDHDSVASRLTLLAKHARRWKSRDGHGTKPVNLISFTPGTSFDQGDAEGKAEERALLFLLLEEDLELRGHRRDVAFNVLQGGLASADRLGGYVADLRHEIDDDLDRDIQHAFLAAAGRPDSSGRSLLAQFSEQLESGWLVKERDDRWRKASRRLVRDLRAMLARESVHLLEPDLIILDEFQRFRHLLERDTEAGELAHHLYDYGSRDEGGTDSPIARTLLLSATPYKPMTLAEEGEDHHTDFLRVIRWLSGGQGGRPQRVDELLAQYRTAVTTGQPIAEISAHLRAELTEVMTRTERPRTVVDLMTREDSQPVVTLSSQWLLTFRDLKKFAKELGAPITVEQWKSAAYFINFADGYRLGEKIRQALKDPSSAQETRQRLRNLHGLDFSAIEQHLPLDPDLGNARLSEFAQATLDRGWWQLLWVPPTLTYLVPAGPYANPDIEAMTKRLVFSSWIAAPTAIAAVLSYEADRRSIGAQWDGMSAHQRETDRNTRRGRLAYSLRDGEPASMNHLSIFWPTPTLAGLADPLAYRSRADHPLRVEEFEQRVQDAIATSGHPHEIQSTPVWQGVFGFAADTPAALTQETGGLARIVQALTGQDEDEHTGETGRGVSALKKHAQLALATGGNRAVPRGVLPDVAAIAAHSPANIAYRALSRLTTGSEVTDRGLWLAAARVAAAFRTLFSKPETTLLLTQLLPEEDYWRSVLHYCAWGNLQAVMDEYLHHLVVNAARPLDDDRLYALAGDAAEAIALRPANYVAFNPADPESTPRLTAHFALRYGTRRNDEESARQPVVRAAFNSPFRPFILATTSAGQEGIDFHWWCHAVVHWNTPASPIDFEQREGRVDRYGGHAVRRNIAEHHASEILRRGSSSPWDAAFEIAAREAAPELGEFAPRWVYPGRARLERHVAPFALSVDETRLARIKRDVAMYRLTFGQPRQEDMLTLLRQQYGEISVRAVDELRLDLRPPSRDNAPHD